MGYAEDSTLYRDADFRGRSEMCIHEQALIFVNDGRADIAALGRGVVAGERADVEALTVAIVTEPGAGDLTTDDVLLSVTQAVWPTVAAARYPQA